MHRRGIVGSAYLRDSLTLRPCDIFATPSQLQEFVDLKNANVALSVAGADTALGAIGGAPGGADAGARGGCGALGPS